ncbi:hypothetical protein HK405_002456 [Cladochytrium tenue]|nr:hypothetical protein HK405_002456 [Cladochytrium tenue]
MSSTPTNAAASLVHGILAYLTGSQPPQLSRILISGLYAAGKASILYKLKFGEVVTTIPTIGINVEPITYKNTTWISWDVGCSEKLRPMLRHYTSNLDALIFVIDSNAPDMLVEAAEELDMLLRVVLEWDADARNPAASAAEKRTSRSHRRFVGTVVFANKQDFPSAMPAAVIEDTLRKIGMDRFGVPWTVVPTSVITGDGLGDGLAWLQDEKDKLAREQEGEARAAAAASSAYGAIHGLAAGFSWLWRPAPDTQPTSASSKAAAAAQGSSLAPAYPTLPSLDEHAAFVVASSDHGLSAAEFRNRFARGELDPFDHRAHLHAGYLVLLNAAKEGKRDSEATELFLHSLKTFLALAGSRVRNTFHVTMSIFWCTVLQLAIQSERHTRFARAAPDLDDDSFPEFLAAQSHVIYSGLWRRYYSQAVIMSRGAASRFVAPDLRPLPTYVVLRGAAGRRLDDAMLAPAYTDEVPSGRGWLAWVARGAAMSILAGRGSDSGQPSSSIENTSVGPSIALFREKEIAWANEDTATFSAWSRGDLDEVEDEELLQHIIYFSVRKGVLKGVHRGKIVKDLVDDLKASGERTGRRYHETHVYLTVQLFTAGLHHWKLTIAQSPASTTAASITTSVTPHMLPSYHLFKVVFPDLCDPHAWRPYYSEALWTSAAARDAFVPPDLRDRLPDTVELDSSIDSRLKTAIASAMAAKAVGGDRKTPTAVQGELQENFMALLGDYDAEVTRRPSVGGNTGDDHSDDSNNDDDRFLTAVADRKLAAPGLHHGRLLRFIFLHLTRVRRRGEPARVATSHIVDGLNDHFKATYLNHLADPDGHTAAASPTNATGSMPRPSSQPPSLRPVAIHPGTTRLFFWIQTVATRLAAARSPDALSDFRSFLLDGATAPAAASDPTGAGGTAGAAVVTGRNWDLADPLLWERYYTPAVMESVEAMGLFVPPDVRRLPSFIVAA